jgi:putative ABC transport system substrate-binding protein
MMLIGRRAFGRVALGAALAPLLGACSKPTVHRIGVLTFGPQNPEDILFLTNPLREYGWVPGENLQAELRSGNWNQQRLRASAEELVAMKPDLIITSGTTATLAARDATRTIPIVFASGTDPVALGFAESLAHPGGNVTGYSNLSSEILAKRARLVHEALPGVKRIGLLLAAASTRLNEFLIGLTLEAYRSVGIEPMHIVVAMPYGAESLASAFAEAFRRQAQALEVLGAGPDLAAQITTATARKIPAIALGRPAIDDGCLLYMGINEQDRDKRVVAIVDKVLRGAKPADIPIEQPTRFTLTLNMKAAKALGIELPQAVLLRADEVIR